MDERSYHDMTWLEFKQAVEAGGIQDTDVIVRIHVTEPYIWHDDDGVECDGVDVYRSIEGKFVVE